MFATTKKVKINGEEIICKDLTYGFLVGIENGSIDETKHATVSNGTGLTEDEVFELRKSEVDELYSVIAQLTYPHLYNDDGTLKESEVIEEYADKKKA